MRKFCIYASPTFMVPQHITPLTHFVPLIQLWAGICAICFYDTLIGYLVATKERKALIKSLTNIKELLHGSLDDHKHSSMTQKIDESLTTFGCKVSHLGKLFCGLSVALLIVAAFETEYSIHYFWLLCVFFISAIYSLLITENKFKGWRNNPWCFIWPLLFGIVLIALCYWVPCYMAKNWNPHWICLAIIALLISPMMCLICRFYMEERMAKYRYKKMQGLKKEFDAFAMIQLTGDTDFNSPDFSEMLRQKLSAVVDRNEKQQVFESYIIDQLDEMFKYDSISRYKCNKVCFAICQWFKSIPNYIRTNSCILWILIFIVLFYGFIGYSISNFH